MKWQPIETAPKDGTPVLGYHNGKMTTVFWSRWNEWILVAPHYTDEPDILDDWRPTYWMPLPAPPPEPKP